MTAAAEQPNRAICPDCTQAFMPWITTCPTCDLALETGVESVALADQVAPSLSEPASSWIDIAVSVDEPVKVALLCHFLTEREIPHEESRRFVSVPTSHADELARAIEGWAFVHELPEDDRHHDSLAATLRDIGNTVLNALHGTRGLAARLPSLEPTELEPAATKSPIDLR